MIKPGISVPEFIKQETSATWRRIMVLFWGFVLAPLYALLALVANVVLRGAQVAWKHTMAHDWKKDWDSFVSGWKGPKILEPFIKPTE